MVRRTKLLLAAAIAALVLSAAVGSAFAEKFEISPAGSITESALGSLTFRSPLITVTCALTLSGSLQTSAQVGEPIGSITSVRGTETCRGATVTANATPWVIATGVPLGTLPNGLTGTRVELFNGGFLFDINFFGIHVKCDYFGPVPALTPLSGTNPYRTGLLTIQTSGQSFELDESLDTSGMCPSGREVSLSGTLSATTETIGARPFALVPTPASPIPVVASQEVFITFRNVSGGRLRIRRFEFVAASAYRLVEQNCFAGALTEIAENATCTATVRWENPGGRRRDLFANIRIYGDPSETFLGGVVIRG